MTIFSLVKRGVDGVIVMFWYHRQFYEAAYERYCGPSLSPIIHAGIADFFSGTWAQGRINCTAIHLRPFCILICNKKEG